MFPKIRANKMPKFDLDFGSSKNKKKERKPVKVGTQKELLLRAKGKCMRCKKSLVGLKPYIHHRSGNRSNSGISNLVVLCPNCHAKVHYKTDGTRRKRPERVGPSKKTKRNGTSRKKRTGYDSLGLPTYRMPKW